MAKASTAENTGDGKVNPDLGSQAQPRQTTPHVDALKADISVAVKIDAGNFETIQNAQKLINDGIAALRAAGAHVTSEVKLGRVKETLFAK